MIRTGMPEFFMQESTPDSLTEKYLIPKTANHETAILSSRAGSCLWVGTGCL